MRTISRDEGLVAAPLPLRHDRGAEQQQRAQQEAREPAEEAAVDGLEPGEQVGFVRLVAVREERDPAQRAALHEHVAREREGTEHGELAPDPLDHRRVLGQALLEHLAQALEHERQADQHEQEEQ